MNTETFECFGWPVRFRYNNNPKPARLENTEVAPNLDVYAPLGFAILKRRVSVSRLLRDPKECKQNFPDALVHDRIKASRVTYSRVENSL